MTKFKVLQISAFTNSVLVSPDGAIQHGDEKKNKITASFVNSPIDVAAFVLLAVILFFFSSAGVASAAEPWWHLTTQLRPASIEPGGEGALVAQALNLGDAATQGAVTVSVALPAGMSVAEEEVKGEPGVFRPKFKFSGFELANTTNYRFFCKVLAKDVTCTLPNGFEQLPYEDVRLTVWVKAGAATEQVRTEVSGGGAAPAVLTRAVPVGSAAPAFGVEHYEQVPEAGDGSVDTQAGSHPFALTTTLSLNQTSDLIAPPALPRVLRFQLPAGVVGNAQAIPRCSEEDFREIVSSENHCPPETVVGVGFINFDEPKLGEQTWPVPIFNLVPAPGEPARFGFTVVKTPVTIDTAVRTGSDYGVTATVSNVSEAINFLSEVVSFWGVPGDPAHELERGYPCLIGGRGPGEGGFNALGEKCLPSTHRAPFLTNPTSCTTGWVSNVEGESWPFRATPEAERQSVPLAASPENSYSLKDQFGDPTAIGGCNELPFSPFIEVAPDVQSASSATGLKVDVKVPQEVSENPSGLASSSVKDITVALPEGVQINPSGANGLEACSEAQAALHSDSESSCPNASKIGTVKIKSPLIAKPLEGSVYLASQNVNPFGSLIAAYIVAEDPESGVLVKLPGEVTLTPSGQVIGTFKNNPQLPFEDAEIHFFGGEKAPLATPARCGTYTTDATFVPWSAEAWDEEQQTKTATSQFTIDSGPNGSGCTYPGQALPFSPSLTGGATNVNAGAFSPFTLTLNRKDGEQSLQSVEAKLPPGLSGVLSNVELCPEPQANLGECGPNSLIGESTVSVGVGGDPYTVSGGKFYLTGPYNGTGACTVGPSQPGCAPFGLTFEVPGKAGPFDLKRNTANPAGEDACDCVIVRGKIEINPLTSALTITSNPPGTGGGGGGAGNYSIPTSIEGIPLEIQHINAITTRGNFQFNPTNCNKMEVTGTIHSSEGGTDTIGVPFQVTNCAALKFTPKFKVSTNAHTSKKDGASLTATVTEPGGGGPGGIGSLGTQANLAKVKVELPRDLPSRLTTLQKACTSKQFEANPAACPSESKIGYAVVHTPLIPVPLEGPAIFVSHGGEAFPSLTMVLQGYGVTIDLVGTTFISKAGVTSTTFKTVPDQPFSSFTLTLPTGKYSALTALGNVCKESLKMPTEFIAQNGAAIHETTNIGVTGCAKTKTRAQKLKASLAACRKQDKHDEARRERCEKAARKNFGPVKQKKAKKKGKRK
jgi:hypothetical protein